MSTSYSVFHTNLIHNTICTVFSTNRIMYEIIKIVIIKEITRLVSGDTSLVGAAFQSNSDSA